MSQKQSPAGEYEENKDERGSADRREMETKKAREERWK
jgi:hypothetical protein